MNCAGVSISQYLKQRAKIKKSGSYKIQDTVLFQITLLGA